MSVKTGYMEAWHELRAYIAERLLGLAACIAGSDLQSGCYYIQRSVYAYFKLQSDVRASIARRSGTANVTGGVSSMSGAGGSVSISEMLKHGSHQR